MSIESLAARPAESSSLVVTIYESLAVLSGEMRQTAEQGEWDSLVGLVDQRRQLLEQLKPIDAVTEINDVVHRRKVQLIEKILADDAEIRKLTRAWMAQLSLNIQSNLQEKRVRQAYGV